MSKLEWSWPNYRSVFTCSYWGLCLANRENSLRRINIVYHEWETFSKHFVRRALAQNIHANMCFWRYTYASSCISFLRNALARGVLRVLLGLSSSFSWDPFQVCEALRSYFAQFHINLHLFPLLAPFSDMDPFKILVPLPNLGTSSKSGASACCWVEVPFAHFWLLQVPFSNVGPEYALLTYDSMRMNQVSSAFKNLTTIL